MQSVYSVTPAEWAEFWSDSLRWAMNFSAITTNKKFRWEIDTWWEKSQTFIQVNFIVSIVYIIILFICLFVTPIHKASPAAKWDILPPSLKEYSSA